VLSKFPKVVPFIGKFSSQYRSSPNPSDREKFSRQDSNPPESKDTRIPRKMASLRINLFESVSIRDS